jgi:hypothetical protein
MATAGWRAIRTHFGGFLATSVLFSVAPVLLRFKAVFFIEGRMSDWVLRPDLFLE